MEGASSQSCFKRCLSFHSGAQATEGRRAEPHTKKVKKTHELIFSWLSWLAVLLAGVHDDDGDGDGDDGGVAQHGGAARILGETW